MKKAMFHKRILVYGQLPPPYHGSNIMTDTFIRAVKKIGFNIKLSNKDFSRNIYDVNKISPVKFMRIFPILYRFFLNLINFRPDLVVYFISATRIGLAVEVIFTSLAHVFHIPYVLYIHAKGHKDIYKKGIMSKKIIIKIFRDAAACFVLGDLFKKQLNEFSKNKIYVLPNCLLDELKLTAHRKDQAKVKLLFLSNLCEAKGLLTLLNSLSGVMAENKNVLVYIAGPWQDSGFKKQVLRLVKQNDLERNVNFLGGKYHKEKEELFSHCDIFVFPTHYPLEVFGLVCIEAMRAGLPVTTDIGLLPEMIIDGETGFLIPPNEPGILAEKINILIKNPDLRNTMGMKGRERFLKYYSFSAYCANLEGILKDLFLRLEKEEKT
jgi:glycosyltransferase involved in cell wall biosynthesis